MGFGVPLVVGTMQMLILGIPPVLGGEIDAPVTLHHHHHHHHHHTEHFLYQGRGECSFAANGSQGRLVQRYIYDRQEFVRFDSDRGEFEAVTPLGEPDVEFWNSQKDILEDKRRAVDYFCHYNYALVQTLMSTRKIQPKLKITPSGIPSTHHVLLICDVAGFWPSKINITWFRNGKEEEGSHVFTTDLTRNGDWTFQMAVLLEAQPERGDVYACQVEHASLPEPVSVQWEAQSKSARRKMWTGVMGLAMGLVFATAGVSLYLKSKKARP